MHRTLNIFSQISKNYRESLVSFAIMLPILWSFTAMFLYEDGWRDAKYIVLLSIGLCIYKYGFSQVKINLQGVVPKVIVLYAITLLFCSLFKEVSSRETKIVFYCMLMAMFIPQYIWKKASDNLHVLVFLGSVCACWFSYHRTYELGLGRGWGIINAIPYSTFAGTLAILALYLGITQIGKNVRSLMMLSILLSFVAIILAEVRGTYLALFITVVLFCFMMAKEKLIRIKARYIAIFLGLFVSLGIINHDRLEQRFIGVTSQEFSSIQSGNYNTSIGYRLQLWRSAVISISENPIFGYGRRTAHLRAQHAQEGIITPEAASFTQYHNQYINTLMTHGLIGFIPLLLLFFIPFYAFWKQRSYSSLGGCLVASMYIIGSLTDIPITYVRPLMFYCVCMLILCRVPNKQEKMQDS